MRQPPAVNAAASTLATSICTAPVPVCFHSVICPAPPPACSLSSCPAPARVGSLGAISSCPAPARVGSLCAPSVPLYPVSNIVSSPVSLCTLSSVCPAPRAEVLDTEGRALALATMPRRTTSLAPLVQGAPAPPPAVNALFSVPRPDRTAQRPWTQTRKAQRSARTVGSVLPPSLEAGGSSIDAVSERVPGSVAQQAALVRAVGSMVSVASHLEAEVPWRRARALVDSGSQQPPLLSLPFA